MIDTIAQTMRIYIVKSSSASQQSEQNVFAGLVLNLLNPYFIPLKSTFVYFIPVNGLTLNPSNKNLLPWKNKNILKLSNIVNLLITLVTHL